MPDKYEMVGAFDFDQAAVDTYNANFGAGSCILADISELDIEMLLALKPDVIIGGPPCQGFSSSNKFRDVPDKVVEKVSVTKKFISIALQLNPTYIIMENVRGLLRNPVYHEISHLLATRGYGIEKDIIKSEYYGVPQIRRRMIIVATKDGSVDLTIELGKYRTNITNVKAYFEDIGLSHLLEGKKHMWRWGQHGYRSVFSVDEPYPTVTGDVRSIPGSYVFHPNDSTKVKDDILVTTPYLRSLLQTFPQDFAFNPKTSKTALNRVIGNAVPPRLSHTLASILPSKERAA